VELDWHADRSDLPELTTLDQRTAQEPIDLAAVGAYRLGRVREQMAAYSVDACILIDPVNIRYATGATAEAPWARQVASLVREYCGTRAAVGVERVNAGAALALRAEGMHLSDAQAPGGARPRDQVGRRVEVRARVSDRNRVRGRSAP
jgi:Xaa-Pro aminopeptidase